MTEQEGCTGVKQSLFRRIGSPFNVEYVLRALNAYQEGVSTHGRHFSLNFLTKSGTVDQKEYYLSISWACNMYQAQCKREVGLQ